jgi:hypothetical protein
MALPYIDNSVPYGSVVLVINTVDYVADDITITKSTKVIERTNEVDEPSGQVIIEGFETGSATLQLATSATAIPAIGDTFTYSTVTYVVSEVGVPKSKGDYTKINISFRKTGYTG